MFARTCWHLLRVAAAPFCRAAAIVVQEFRWQMGREAAIRDGWTAQLGRDEANRVDYFIRPARP